MIGKTIEVVACVPMWQPTIGAWFFFALPMHHVPRPYWRGHIYSHMYALCVCTFHIQTNTYYCHECL